ncbi:MAG: hypothetical protein HZC41_12735 [Chloroflexi bacterium]|nr:hypothetical protein [Chloroflexota bacterium]
MARQKHHLRQQIAQTITEPVAPFEHKIAESLQKRGEFQGNLTSEQLSIILRKVLFTMVGEQKVAGFDVPIVHNVSAMKVDIRQCEAKVFAEIHVHSPIIAFIQFRYVLENDRRSGGKKLRLKDNCMDVKEVTRPLDLAAKAALAIMGVKQIALRELADPNAVIQRTLPPQLGRIGFQGRLAQVDLELLNDNTMWVYVAGDGRH